MATNKHAIIRYQTLDKCFRNPGRRYYIEDLIDACNEALFNISDSTDGIKRRQLFEDIRFMESDQGWNIPLERVKDGKRVFYRYNDSNFSINNQPLNETEENQLKEALFTLSRFKGMPQFEWMEEITTRLDAGLGLSHVPKQIIEFEQNKYLKGLEFISTLYDAIVYEKVLHLSYKSFKSEEIHSFTFHPYYLKQYNNRWFVFGFTSEFSTISNFALDRIIELEENNTIEYFPNNSINFEDYFEDVIGVTVKENGPIERIDLEIDNSLFPYIQSKPLHDSQKVVNRTENSTTIRLELQINYELITSLFSFGSRIKVIQPDLLKEEMIQRANSILKNYF
jgi:predicted DNA-binding transcriptional regulator YafY